MIWLFSDWIPEAHWCILNFWCNY